MTATHCDIETGMIYGAEEGTKAWFHEEAHLKFNESTKGSTLHLYQKYLLHAWMLCFSASILMGKPFYYLALSTLFGYFGIEMYEELWCEKYAKQKLNEKEEENGRKTSSGENGETATNS